MKAMPNLLSWIMSDDTATKAEWGLDHEDYRMTCNVRYLLHTRGVRLMALLLAVLLLVASLPGHATMDDCAVDCGTSQVEMPDHTVADCGACAALTATPIVPRVPPDALVDLADPAVVEFIATPPREPPKS